MIIDCHVHAAPTPEKNPVKELLESMDKSGIDMEVVLTTRPEHDDSVFFLAESHPDRFIPFPSCRPGTDTPKGLRQKAERGAKGFKVIRPEIELNHTLYDELYATAEELDLPVLIHVANKCYERPDFAGDIARRFPKLRIIAAHIGYPWYEEGCLISRIYPNCYCDTCTDQPNGWTRDFWTRGGKLTLVEKPTIAKLEYYLDEGGTIPEVPWDKFCFGTDFNYRRVIVKAHAQKKVTGHYHDLFDLLDLPKETREKVWSGNVKKIIGID